MKRSTALLVTAGATALAVSVSVPLVRSLNDTDSPARETGAPAERTLAPAPSGTPAKDFVLSLPLAAYSLTREQQVLLDRAQIRLQETCVRRLSSSDLPPREVPDASAAVEPSRRYGIVDMESAKRYGYQSPDTPSSTASLPRPNETQAMLLSGRTSAGKALKTYKGHAVPEGGCNAESRDAIYKDHDKEPGIAVAQQIDIDSYKRSLQDSRVSAAFSDWSRCMKRAGYTYESPMKVADDPEFADANYSKRERSVAVADVTCKFEVRLPQTWIAVESAIQKKMIERRQSALTHLSESQKLMVQRARRVLAEK